MKLSEKKFWILFLLLTPEQELVLPRTEDLIQTNSRSSSLTKKNVKSQSVRRNDSGNRGGSLHEDTAGI
jgi:hypothetical protein